MIQTVVEYDKPIVEVKFHHRFEGTLTRIVKYEFSSHSDSSPGCNADRNEIKTTFLLKEKGRLETLGFMGFVGNELVGQEVCYEDMLTEKTILFDPKGRENDRSYRKGCKTAERVCRISPLNKNLPFYISKETSQTSL